MTYPLTHCRLEEITSYINSVTINPVEIRCKKMIKDLLHGYAEQLDRHVRDLDMTEEHGWRNVRGGEFERDVETRQAYYEHRLDFLNGVKSRG